MENSNNSFQSNSEGFDNKIVQGLIQFLYMLVFILFLCPFNFWKQAVYRLAESRNNGSWKFSESKSRWPFLSFLKAIIFSYVFDGGIFISYFIGVIMAIYYLFIYGFETFITILIVSYYEPVIISFVRDILTIILMPFSKFLSWCARPAQYLEIDMNKKN